MRILILLFIVSCVLGYISWHMWIMIPLPKPYRAGLIFLAIALFFLIPVIIFNEEHIPLSICGVLNKVTTSWFFIMLYLFMVFILTDVIRFMIPSLRPLFISSWKATALTVILISAIFIYGNIRYHHKVRVPLNIKISKPLPHPYKIVFISDLHLGYTIGAGELSRWVDMINKENPDIILIGGDIVDFSTRPLSGDTFASQLRRFNAPLGVYACLGNHDHIAHADKSIDFFKRSHIRPLIDESVLADSAFYIIGRDDMSNRRRQPLPHLIGNKDANTPVIVLDHQPYHLDRAQHAGIDLQLSGHTHRGQVFPINLITDYLYQCSHGYIKMGNTHVCVSSGIGIWGGKFRIGSQSEYVVITLTGTPAT